MSEPQDNATPAARPFIPVRIAVMTVSDTRTLETDRSGQVISELVAAAGHQLSGRTIVKDDVGQIRRVARNWLKRDDIDVILSTGGTGLTGRDITVEAFRFLFEKEIEGFSVAFHMLSWAKIGSSTVQSRATAGVAKGKFIFCLPGSPGACRDAWEGILKAQLDYRHLPCNFIEIMPRLEEHLQRGKSQPMI
jgi:molybdenum cofactor biosynthesis protein B